MQNETSGTRSELADHGHSVSKRRANLRKRQGHAESGSKPDQITAVGAEQAAKKNRKHGGEQRSFQGLRCLQERRARDSNPQPLAGYLSSSEAAHQFAYPPRPWLARQRQRPATLPWVHKRTTVRSAMNQLQRGFCSADQLDELFVALEAAELLGQLLHGITGMHAAERTTQHRDRLQRFFIQK